jgi:tetratricopeptide (TPR) repeat protein
VLLAIAIAGAAAAEAPIDAARALLASYHEDPPRLDRARDVLEAAAARAPTAEMLATLARTWFLVGEFRARTERERLAAYERGRDAGRRAIAAAPDSEQAHVWYALNSARWAGTRGIMRAVGVVPTLRDEAATILRLNPASVEGHTLAGGLAAELPAVLGGDRSRAEEHFRKALDADPHRTGARVELARLYIATRRYADAERELQRVVEEPAPSDLPYWALSDLPRARALLAALPPPGIAVRPFGGVGAISGPPTSIKSGRSRWPGRPRASGAGWRRTLRRAAARAQAGRRSGPSGRGWWCRRLRYGRRRPTA